MEKHSSKLETAVAKSTILDGEIAALQAELGELSKSQLEMDTMRAEERKTFARAKEDVEQGISGVQKGTHHTAKLLRIFVHLAACRTRGPPEFQRRGNVNHWLA